MNTEVTEDTEEKCSLNALLCDLRVLRVHLWKQLFHTPWV